MVHCKTLQTRNLEDAQVKLPRRLQKLAEFLKLSNPIQVEIDSDTHIAIAIAFASAVATSHSHAAYMVNTSNSAFFKGSVQLRHSGPPTEDISNSVQLTKINDSIMERTLILNYKQALCSHLLCHPK